MVLYKRKKVIIDTNKALPEDLSKEVFYIPKTREWFYTYEEYLSRMDYYNQNKFVCEITGNSTLNYFKALESEEKEIESVEKKFPEALKEHILRHLQFNRTTRLDHLVDQVYLTFKEDFFPGEVVFIKGTSEDGGDTGSKQKGIIKEKIQYSNPIDGLTTRYLITKLDDKQQLILTSEKIFRDRNLFTKWLIRAFIRLTVTRTNKIGAPWVAKDEFAKRFRIPQEYPEDLKHFEVSSKNKNASLKKEESNKKDTKKSSDTKKSIKDDKAKLKQKGVSEGERKRKLYPALHLPLSLETMVDKKEPIPQPNTLPGKKYITDDLSIKFNLQHPKSIPDVLLVSGNAKEITREPHGLSSLKTVQEALECWAFLNVFHNVLKLDTFTLDDFIYAMGWNYDQFVKIGRCQLLDEIWCAILNAFVPSQSRNKGNVKNEDEDNFQLLVNLPQNEDIGESGNDNLESSHEVNSEFIDENRNSNTEEGLNEKENSHDTSLEACVEDGTAFGSENGKNGSKTDATLDNGNLYFQDDEGDDGGGDEVEHNAYKVMNFKNVSWYSSLQRRNFKDGNWQCILLGILSKVEYVNSFRGDIEKVYRTLAPSDQTATPSTVLTNFYGNMDINLRLRTMSILTSLLTDGKAVREYINNSLEFSTTLRRNRLDVIKDLKNAMTNAQNYNLKIYEIIFPKDSNKTTDKWKLNSKTNISPAKKASDGGHDIVDENELNKKRIKLDMNAFEMTNEEKAIAAKNKRFRDLWKNRKETLVQADNSKKAKREIERQLNEYDCQRMKLLGKDRFFNRYWWFENNGLPTLRTGFSNEDEDDNQEEEEKESEELDVLNETYLVGKLWVQGPCNDDLKNNLKVSLEETNHLSEKLTVMFESNSNIATIDSQNMVQDNKKKKDDKLHEMDFSYLNQDAEEVIFDHFDLKFRSDGIFKVSKNTKKQECVVDKYGGLVSDLSSLLPMQRKVIEEIPQILLNGTCWRYYESESQIEQLIRWLNPWGSRESQLRKELISAKDSIICSIKARRKALLLDEELILEDSNEEKQESIESPGEHAYEKGDKEKLKDNDVELGNDGYDSGELGDERKSHLSPEEQAKRQNFEEDRSEDADKSVHFSAVLAQAQKKREELELGRVLEWVNLKCIQEYDRSHYEGGQKTKGRPPKNKLI